MATRTSTLSLFVLCVAMAAACGHLEPSDHHPPAGAADTAAGSVGARSPAEATYVGIYERPVRLTGGMYEGEPFVEGGAARPRLVLATGPELAGDLDGDGRTETIAFLDENSGGTGRFGYVAVLADTDKGLVNTATATPQTPGSPRTTRNTWPIATCS